MNENIIPTTAKPQSKKKPRWGKTFRPGFRQLRSSGIFFLNKFIAGKHYGDSLETANKKIAEIKARKRIDAITKLAHMSRTNPNAATIDPKQLTFGALVADFKREIELAVQAKQIDPQTQHYKERTMRAIEKSWDECPKIVEAGLSGFAKLNPDRVRLRDCKEWFAHLAASYAPQFTNNTLSDFRKLWDIAINDYNPTLTNLPRQLKRVPIVVSKLVVPTEELWEKIMRQPMIIWLG